LDRKKVALNQKLGDRLGGDSLEDVVEDGANIPANIIPNVDGDAKDVFPTVGDPLRGDVMDGEVDGNDGNGPEDVDRDGDRDPEDVDGKDGNRDPEDVDGKGGNGGPGDVGGNGDDDAADNCQAVISEGNLKDEHAMEEDVDGNVDGDDWRPRSRSSSMSSLSSMSAQSDQPTVGVDSHEESSDAMEVDGSNSPIAADLAKLSESLEHLTEPAETLAIEGATPMVGVESNQVQLDDNGPTAGSSLPPLGLALTKAAPPRIGRLVNPETANCLDDLDSLISSGLAAPLVLRRSSRNANSKNKSTLQILPPKTSSRRRRPAPKKDGKFLEVSFWTNST
jgi:hypothetical protein